MNDIWDWFNDKESEYEEKEDWERLKMAQAHQQATDLGETAPLAMIKMFKQGRDKAKRLGEPWWVFLYDV